MMREVREIVKNKVIQVMLKIKVARVITKVKATLIIKVRKMIVNKLQMIKVIKIKNHRKTKILDQKLNHKLKKMYQK